ncbi:unnamed protein product, partial [Scytosiphon promiscuus]
HLSQTFWIGGSVLLVICCGGDRDVHAGVVGGRLWGSSRQPGGDDRSFFLVPQRYKAPPRCLIVFRAHAVPTSALKSSLLRLRQCIACGISLSRADALGLSRRFRHSYPRTQNVKQSRKRTIRLSPPPTTSAFAVATTTPL